MSIAKANDDTLQDFIRSNDGWTLLDGKLHKEFVFANFKHAFAFMTFVAEYAETHNHHPEWFNVYRHVKVDLITHEVSGISERDFKMANYMDAVAEAQNE
jgi:4a-hydroxytetrahydrobiopterin dehydratase